MKNTRKLQFRIAAAVAIMSLIGITAAVNVVAIPNQVGGSTIIPPFFNPAGMRLEDFANRKALWLGDAELKGDWEMWSDDSVNDSTIEVLRLKNSASVFGAKASSVTVHRRDMIPLQFEVRFSTREEARSGSTRTQLITNINAWSGGSISAEQPVLEHEAVSVSLGDEIENEITVTLQPIPSRGS